jgi:hypothetical protein
MRPAVATLKVIPPTESLVVKVPELVTMVAQPRWFEPTE